MYSPTTRLLTLLELLQSHQQLSGSDLARRLEVDGRTVRRYIVMLQDMGIPIEAERGPYGAYQLQRGHKLPPLMFTDAEAVALTLGLLAMREYRFPVEMTAVEGALAKTERVLPEQLFYQVRGLQEAILFNVYAALALPQREYLTTLSAAIQQRRQVYLRYLAWNGEETERDFDPYGIVFNVGYWYSAGYCHLRQDLRTFRLDHIAVLEPREQSFERPADFDVLSYVLNSISMSPGSDQVEVLLEATLEQARQALPSIIGHLEPVEQGVMLRRASSQMDWVAHVLLSVDFPVHVVKSAELRDRLRQMAVRALQIAGDDREHFDRQAT